MRYVMFERQQTIQIKQPLTRELNICIQRRHCETFSWNSYKVPPAPLDQVFHNIVWSFLSSSQGLCYVSFRLNWFKMFQHLYLYQERVFFFVLCPSEVPLKKKMMQFDKEYSIQSIYSYKSLTVQW